MDEVQVTNAPMCTCNKPMTYVMETQSWKCLSCNPEIASAPICKTVECKRPLTRLGPPWNCWICLHCNTHPATRNKQTAEATEEKKRKLVDETMTEKKVTEIVAKTIKDIVREELANLNIPQPPVTRAEINQLPESQSLIAPENWRIRAKRLGVRLTQETGGVRKKADVLADIEKAESPKGDTNDSPVTAEKGK